jgi:anti-anti-sigma regulatory factor
MTQSNCIELAERLTIAQAAELHRSLCTVLAGGAPIAVDGTRVQEIDTAILQVLVSLWESSRAGGIPCVWHGVSDGLRRAAGLIGLTETLHFPDDESAGGRADVIA